MLYPFCKNLNERVLIASCHSKNSIIVGTRNESEAKPLPSVVEVGADQTGGGGGVDYPHVLR